MREREREREKEIFTYIHTWNNTGYFETKICRFTTALSIAPDEPERFTGPEVQSGPIPSYLRSATSTPVIIIIITIVISGNKKKKGKEKKRKLP